MQQVPENPNRDARFAEVKELGEACKKGDIARVTSLLQKHPDVLDSPDRDARFPYPEFRPCYSAGQFRPARRIFLSCPMRRD